MSRRAGKFFLVSEFDSKDGVTVPASAERELEVLVETLLDPLRRRFGRTIVLSGYRTIGHNRAVGGAPRSFHLYTLEPGRGVAADVRCARGRPDDWHRFLNELGAGGLGIYGLFVHVDTRRVRSRWTG
jgi:uncharacterized protein YcbK (DUF882 family)